MTRDEYIEAHNQYEDAIIEWNQITNTKEKQKQAECIIDDIRKNIENTDDIDEKIFLYTVVINSGLLEYCTVMLKEFVLWVKDIDIAAEEQLYLYRQINHTIFVTLYVQNEENKIMMWKWHRGILEMWKKQINFRKDYIPYDKRNHDLYVIITEQLIAFQHAPTKTALERCKVIIKNMNKKVLLINTAECVSSSGKKNIFHPVEGSYMESYLEKEYIEWKDTKIPLFSCEKNSIYPDTMEVLMKAIYDMAPEFVIDISGESILGNLCADFIPVVGMGLNPSELSNSLETYHVVYTNLGDKEKRLLEKMKISYDKVINCIFTSDLRQQNRTYTKEELEIDNTKIQLAIVGARLNQEMTSEFISMLEQLNPDRYQIHICGKYTNISCFNADFYNKCCVYHGMVEDMLAFMEHMDLNINPMRMGGGMSAVEAMEKGVPVITARRGDVYTNTGEEFGVENYEEMLQMIEKYSVDKEFYQKMSERAKERATYLQDTDGIFTALLNEVRTREIAKK